VFGFTEQEMWHWDTQLFQSVTRGYVLVTATFSLDRYRSEFSSSQFLLLIDERSIRSEVFFMDQIPTGDSRDKDVSFLIDSSNTQAVLRIQVGLGSAEIPLEISPLASHS
jgi:hypothetical protein